jgi:exosortase sorting signal-containing protein
MMAFTLRNLLPVSIFIFSLLALALVPMPGGSASAQECAVAICKVAPQVEGPFVVDPGELVTFTFDWQVGSDEPQQFDLDANGRCIVLPAGLQTPLRVVEEPLPGWTLSDIQCDQQPGVSVSFIENGAIFSCDSPTEPIVECDFVNLIVRDIPTLSEWGMIATAAGLGLVGVFFAVRRRRMQAGV